MCVCLSVCVFAIHAKTAGPIATKLGGKLEEHLGRNLGILPSKRSTSCEREARARIGDDVTEPEMTASAKRELCGSRAARTSGPTQTRASANRG